MPETWGEEHPIKVMDVWAELSHIVEVPLGRIGSDNAVRILRIKSAVVGLCNEPINEAVITITSGDSCLGYSLHLARSRKCLHGIHENIRPKVSHEELAPVDGWSRSYNTVESFRESLGKHHALTSSLIESHGETIEMIVKGLRIPGMNALARSI
ncbi:hypothetical protein M7I_5257 [Glarea lozoyensis 74030]|uniref:Uncharacterized protein n=1 Tax=Glarea lozoyensis (strain ATCC 74030 / MF5533) TaxID=1104152 RepID=H0ERD8_GLAL7|nr:hypothetical protein M7I_5257 [Glarea lozoyensis 74030]